MPLTPQQRQVLDALIFLLRKGESPTVREIGALADLRSPATVMKHLQALEAAGYVESNGRSRGIRVVKDLGVPIVGRIAAGQPIETEDAPDSESGSGFGFEEVPVDPSVFVPGAAPGEVVALRVHGDSMVEAGILDGDLVMIRRQAQVEDGEIAAVLVDGEGTLKRWHGRGGRAVRLDPANERFAPIEVRAKDAKDVRVFGKYVGLLRGR